MIVLDTNVISEAMRADPDVNVRGWLNNQSAQTLHITAVSVTELRYGVERLPEGKRKAALRDVLDFTLRTLFDTRVLPFDGPAAEMTARLFARAEAQGQAIGFADGQIAGITAHHGFTVATRDSQPFVTAGVPVIDPWIATPKA